MDVRRTNALWSVGPLVSGGLELGICCNFVTRWGTVGQETMKYIKKLKNERSDLTHETPAKRFRYVILTALIALVKEVRAVDNASDTWTEETAPTWDSYLGKLETWLQSMPKRP